MVTGREGPHPGADPRIPEFRQLNQWRAKWLKTGGIQGKVGKRGTPFKRDRAECLELRPITGRINGFRVSFLPLWRVPDW
jgi:hypothetical protein